MSCISAEEMQKAQAKAITKEDLRNAIMTIRNYCKYYTGNDCDQGCWLYSNEGYSVCKLLRFAPLRWSKDFIPEDIPESDIAEPSIANGTFKVVENDTAKWIPDDAAYKEDIKLDKFFEENLR